MICPRGNIGIPLLENKHLIKNEMEREYAAEDFIDDIESINYETWNAWAVDPMQTVLAEIEWGYEEMYDAVHWCDVSEDIIKLHPDLCPYCSAHD